MRTEYSDVEPDTFQRLEAELAAAKRELEHSKRAWQTQLQIAARVHESLLPRPVRRPQIEIDTRYVAVDRVGGDYCQVLFPDESCCYVTMCDVTGHGIGPALLATRVSSEVRRLVLERRSPVEIVQALNSFVFKYFYDTDLPLTFFAAQFDLMRGTLTYSGAGHPSPFLIRPDSRSIEMLESQNLLIGVEEQCLGDRPEASLKVGQGDRFVFYTDGLTETMDSNGNMLGPDGLARIAAITCAGSPGEVGDCILERVAALRGGPPQDDMTLIIAELKS